DRARESSLKRNARKALAEAISELLIASPDIDTAEAKIAVAKAAGIIERDLFTAQNMLKTVRKAAKRSEQATKQAATRKRSAARRHKRPAKRAK
ncbi:MAG: hypothetical protein ACREUQ_06985, partial [Burkholderiales bacterium]